MLIWAGKGIWALVIPAFFWLIGAALFKMPGAIAGVLLGTALIWYFGQKFNDEDDNQHTLFFIPMQWAAVALAIFLIIAAFNSKF